MKYNWDEVKRLYLFGDEARPTGYEASEIAKMTGVPQGQIYKKIYKYAWNKQKEEGKREIATLISDENKGAIVLAHKTMLNNIGGIFQDYSNMIRSVLSEFINTSDDEMTKEERRKYKLDIIKALGGTKGLLDLISSARTLSMVAKDATEEELEDRVIDKVRTMSDEQLEQLIEQTEQTGKLNAN